MGPNVSVIDFYELNFGRAYNLLYLRYIIKLAVLSVAGGWVGSTESKYNDWL